MKKGAKAKGFEVWSVVRVGDAVEGGDSCDVVIIVRCSKITRVAEE